MAALDIPREKYQLGLTKLFMKAGTGKALEELDLGNCGIEAAGGNGIAEGLQFNTVLTSLDLKYNGIFNDGGIAMADALTEWANHDGIAAVMIDHAEGRGFCAGGDIAMLRNSALNDEGKTGREFFHAEYRLNHQLFTYTKPVVAFMDGITMGGGIGLAGHASHRIVTERSMLAMPETRIGFTPDVGGSWLLGRAPGVAEACGLRGGAHRL